MARNDSNTGLAIVAEAVPGFFLQTFGIGHMLSGEILKGLGVMFLYWILQSINAALCLVLIGFITAPLTWLAFMVLSPANIAANEGY